jgi:hypothetical protein
MPDLGSAIEDRIGRFQPAAAPGFDVVRARRRRRVAARCVVAVAAVGGVSAAVAPYALGSSPVDSVHVAAPRPSPSAERSQELPSGPSTPVPAPGSGAKQQPDARDRAAQQLWRSKGAKKYMITLTVMCFCAGAGTPHQVWVEGGIPAPGPSDRGPSVVSIEMLFDMINRGEGERYTVVYDQTYGYPKQISFDRIVNAIDDEVSYEILAYHPG